MEKEEHTWRRKTSFLQSRRQTEKEKEEYIWRKKISFCGGEEKWRGKKEEIFGEGTFVF